MTQNFFQIYKIDYTKTFTLRIKCKPVKICLAIALMLGMIFVQIDIIKLYLESTISQNKHVIQMKIIQKYLVGKKKLVCKILKSLDGLKQAKRFWNKILTKFF